MMKFKGSRVVVAAAGINFIGGILYIWSVISKGLVNDLGWSSKEASLPYTIATVSFVIAMVFFGRLQDMKGPRFTATIASILIGSGLILSGLVINPLTMILTFGIISGIGIGASNVSATPPAIKWFAPEKKGMITGIVVAGVGLSSIFFSPLANHLMSSVGIPKTFIYIGVGSLIVAVALAQMIENPPIDYVPGGSDNGGQRPENKINNVADSTWREMLKTKNFYKLWIMFGFSSSAGLMIIGHISNIAKVQIDWESGFLLVIFLAIFNTLGRFVGGTISDKIGRINLMRMIFSIQAINMFMFSKFESISTLAVGVAIAGICYGAAFSVFPATISDLYGTKHFGVNYGLIFTGWGVGGVIGPMTAAVIFDATEAYSISYLVASILLIISAFIAFTFKDTKNFNNVLQN